MNPSIADQDLGNIEDIEIAMLELLLQACGVYEGELSQTGQAAVVLIGEREPIP